MKEKKKDIFVWFWEQRMDLLLGKNRKNLSNDSYNTILKVHLDFLQGETSNVDDDQVFV